MNKKFIIPSIIIASVLIGISLVSLNFNDDAATQNDSTFTPMYFPGKIAEAYQQSSMPIKEICRSNTVQETKELTGMDFKTLKLLPEKFKMVRAVDLDSNMGQVMMNYNYGHCDEGGPISPYKGGIEVRAYDVNRYLSDGYVLIVGNSTGQERIEKLSEWRAEIFENRTQTAFNESDRFITMNGQIAVIDEPGYTTDRYWDFDTGELLYKEAVTYPGKITFLDEDFEIYYSIKGYFGANELIQMAESMR